MGRATWVRQGLTNVENCRREIAKNTYMVLVTPATTIKIPVVMNGGLISTAIWSALNCHLTQGHRNDH